MAAVNEHDDTFDTLGDIWDDAEFTVHTNTHDIISPAPTSALTTADFDTDLFSQDPDVNDPLDFLPSNHHITATANGWTSFLDDSCPFRRRVKSSINFSPTTSLAGKRSLSNAYSPSRKRSRTSPTLPFSLAACPLVPRRSRSTALMPTEAFSSDNDNESIPLKKSEDLYDVLPIAKEPIMEDISSSEDEKNDDDDVPLTKLKPGKKLVSVPIASRPLMLGTNDGVPVSASDKDNSDGYITPNLSGRLASILLMSASSSAFSTLSSSSSSTLSTGKNFAPVNTYNARTTVLPCVSSAVAAVTMAAQNYSRSLAMK